MLNRTYAYNKQLGIGCDISWQHSNVSIFYYDL